MIYLYSRFCSSYPQNGISNVGCHTLVIHVRGKTTWPQVLAEIRGHLGLIAGCRRNSDTDLLCEANL